MDNTPDRPYEHRLRVRYGETDQMGRVHHANYLLYFEEARTGMMRALGASYASCEAAGIGLPVRKADLRYRRGANYEEEVTVETTIERVGPASVTFAYRCVSTERGDLLASGTTELACIDLASGELRKLPEDLAATFEGGAP